MIGPCARLPVALGSGTAIKADGIRSGVLGPDRNDAEVGAQNARVYWGLNCRGHARRRSVYRQSGASRSESSSNINAERRARRARCSGCCLACQEGSGNRAVAIGQ